MEGSFLSYGTMRTDIVVVYASLTNVLDCWLSSKQHRWLWVSASAQRERWPIYSASSIVSMCVSIASSPTTTRWVPHYLYFCKTYCAHIKILHFHPLPFSVSCSHICNGSRTATTTLTVLCVVLCWMHKTQSDWSATVRLDIFHFY